MAPRLETAAQREIWQFVRDLNDTWVRGRPEDLAAYFHERMAILAPGSEGRLEGREACVDSYRDFCSRSVVHDLRLMNPSIDVFGDTAIATYSFEITYELEGQSCHETGRDVFVLVREGGKWRAVWRTLLPAAGPDAA